ncbi:MAG: hypothetical protein P8K83_03085 [Woeseiaceae bacterium]|nr:hypothetical protein [Woeseiaceae bacterium]
MKKLLAFFLSTSILLTSCGGGSTGGSGVNSNSNSGRVVVTPVLKGRFTDSAVKGLTYTTYSQSGITNTGGEFNYKAGETIQFSIGNFALGNEVPATAEMTPASLISGVALPTTTSELALLLNQAEKKPGYPAAAGFNKLHNMLTFLQALDKDKNATNGITIDSGIGALLEGVNLDFTDSYSSFRNNFVLRKLLKEAAAQNLVGSVFIKYPGRVLDHFYDAQGINYSIMNADTRSYDDDADGTTDRIYTYTFDSDGRVRIASLDMNGDGVAEQVYTYTNDNNGSRLSATLGNITIYTRTYNGYGSQLTDSRDPDGDGIANFINTYTYDSYGNLLSDSNDTDGDGIANTIMTYTYDSDGNRVGESIDTGGDGTTDHVLTKTYDSDGNLLTTRTISTSSDSLQTYTYDSNGNDLTYTQEIVSGTGITNYSKTRTYDSNGNELTYSEDTNGDGSINQVWTYTYDSNGNELTKSIDSNGDGIVDLVDTRTYDSDGNELTSTLGNTILTRTYDSNGNELTYSDDINGDGTPEEILTLTYVPTTISGYMYTH